MPKQKVKKSVALPAIRNLAVLAVVATALVGGGLAYAAKYDAQIKILQKKNGKAQDIANDFASQAHTYQEAVDRLESQINSLQASIDRAQKESEKVSHQIDLAQKELDHDKKVLGESIRAMYEEGQITTIEILASSNDLSDFVNKQEYRNAIQDKVKGALDKVNELKTELESKQRQLASLIRDKKNEEEARQQAQDKQQQLLSYSTSRKHAYQQEIDENLSKIGHYRALQAAANASHFGASVTAGDPNHGGYPAYLDNAYQDSLIDPWGMFNRECVSYTAWKVQQTFGYMPYWGGHGNAIQWPGSAQAAGIATGSTPKRHSVAIWPVGFFGHAMWVEDVYSNGYIRVSQYNYDFTGHYSEMTIPSGGLTYIYFH